MITSNVIERTFHIKYKDNTGTCFAIDHDNKQYIVTAKHVIKDIKDSEEVEIYYKNRWVKTRINLTGHSTTSDVSVFSIQEILSLRLLPPDIDGIVYGQDVFFLGFPYGLSWDAGIINWEFPVPLVKKGILSALYLLTTEKYFYVDGNNNPGFSGGPLVFQAPGSKKKYFQVAGIVAGFQAENEQVFDASRNFLNAYVSYNTGIILCYSIQNAIDLIVANPNGAEIKKIL